MTALRLFVSKDAPAAPYPRDTQTKGWRFELDIERIKQSDTWALCDREMRPWLFMVWVTAWEQIPCGSLPNDDALIAARIDMPLRTFQVHRESLMRAWWLADDGRLYHPTITEKVLDMLAWRTKEAKRKADYRAYVKQQLSDICPTGQTRTGDGLHPEGRPPSPSPSPSPINTREASPLVDTPAAPRPKPPACPTQQIVDLYHELLPTLPRVEVMSDSRKRALSGRWREVCADKEIAHADDPRAAALDWWRWYFARAATSKFLTGQSKDWRASFDFLLTPSKFAKVIEGAYR